MKNYFLYCCLFLPFFLNAQATKITYKVYGVEGKPKTGVLVVNTQLVSFYSEKKADSVASEEKTVTKKGNHTYTEVKLISGGKYKNYQVYLVQADSLLNVVDIGYKEKPVKFKEKFEKIQWQFTDDTKSISGYTCHQAKCTFRGRDYTAWFTPEIPIRIGPWKFNNLPGAILQVYDQTKEFSWNAKSVTHLQKDQKLPDFIKHLKLFPSYKAYVEKDLYLEKKYIKQRLIRSTKRKYGNNGDINIDLNDMEVSHDGLERIYPWEK